MTEKELLTQAHQAPKEKSMDFETWFERLIKEDANPAGLRKLQNVMREAWDAGRQTLAAENSELRAGRQTLCELLSHAYERNTDAYNKRDAALIELGKVRAYELLRHR